MQKKQFIGHALALFTVCVWGTTFVSIKVLLQTMTAGEILLSRFALGVFALIVVWPRRMRVEDRKHEWYFAGAGLTGVAIYYMLENIALTYGSAAHISVIVSAAPLFTALIAARLGEHKLKPSFFAGFTVALCGIALISMTGEANLSPFGDLLALIAAIAWGFYAILTRRIEELGYPTIPATRRIFVYGLLWMLLPVHAMGFHVSFAQLAHPVTLGNLAFLSFGAGALGFVTWNRATGILGAVETSVYIYLTPVVTVFTAALVLGERVNLRTGVGIFLVITGLILSEGLTPRLKQERKETANVGAQRSETVV